MQMQKHGSEMTVNNILLLVINQMIPTDKYRLKIRNDRRQMCMTHIHAFIYAEVQC